MSQSYRQTELFAGHDWQVLYRAFDSINFNASDPGSINMAMREYIRANYAEDFSDWIESSEFVAIIDLLAWLAGNLAIKSDIAARENFLETAEARESILRLARFLSYRPKRNYPARGLLKIIELQTNDDVFDAVGVNLANRRLIWNNPDDPDWAERFVLVLNSAIVNQFGVPLKTGSMDGVQTQLYRFNGDLNMASLSFSANVSGQSMEFEVINGDFDSDKGFFERTPDLLSSSLHLIYRSDGNGAASPRTGFFVPFKQGRLQYTDQIIDYPAENQVFDIAIDGINETDVWVQTINDNGEVEENWTQVPAVFSENITFNSVGAATRTIYSVVTRDRDQISLRFADGRFGKAPVGRMRFWFRSSNGLEYQIRPIDMQRIQVTVPYYNRLGTLKTLTMVLALVEPVSNSTASESDEQIKRRAPLVYATQDRMVSGEDYNTYVLQSNLATKIKSLVRVYPGHTRHLDMHDPTGSYQGITAFADDGMFYKERTTSYSEVPVSENKTANELIDTIILPMLQETSVKNVVQDYLLRQARSGNIIIPQSMRWKKANEGRFYSTGWVTQYSDLIAPGASVLVEKNGISKWVNVRDILGTDMTASVPDGVPGPILLSEPVEDDSNVVMIVPAYAPNMGDDVLRSIRGKLMNNLSFSLWYDYAPDGETHWVVRNPETLETQPQVIDTRIKLMTVDYIAGSVWRFRTPGLRYVFESLKKVRFFYDGARTIDPDTRQQVSDLVRILRINEKPQGGLPLGRDYDLALIKPMMQPNGYSDPRRIEVVFNDKDEDGFPDDPDTYYHVVGEAGPNTLLFWERNDDGDYVPTSNIWVYERSGDREALPAPVGTIAFQIEGDNPETFWLMREAGWEQQFRRFKFATGRGPNVARKWIKAGGDTLTPSPVGSAMFFQWKHYAPSDRRIDPARTTIIDTFVLTSEYDRLTRRWIAAGAKPEDMPVPPTDTELRTTFGEYAEKKMFSDEIIWRPARYKFLFGRSADPALRAKFKVIKLPNSVLSDGEIKTRVINSIDEYFHVDYWDFGETFYYTELAAFIHHRLANAVASVVIVPLQETSAFGDGFEVRCRPDELFISTATVEDVEIISANTHTNLRIR
jgi:hypothetical protein